MCWVCGGHSWGLVSTRSRVSSSADRHTCMHAGAYRRGTQGHRKHAERWSCTRHVTVSPLDLAVRCCASVPCPSRASRAQPGSCLTTAWNTWPHSTNAHARPTYWYIHTLTRMAINRQTSEVGLTLGAILGLTHAPIYPNSRLSSPIHGSSNMPPRRSSFRIPRLARTGFTNNPG